METPLVCDLNAFTPEQRRRHEEVSQRLFASRQEVRELADGYAFRFPGDLDSCLLAGEFISHEHICCPFFRLELEIEPGQGALWMRITGGEAIKQFVKVEMGIE